MGKALKSAAQATSNWVASMQNVTQKVTQGVQAVTQAPGIAAAAQQSAYLAGVQQSAGKWATNVAAVPLASWQQSMVSKGAPRMASGATAAQGKMQSAMTRVMGMIQNAISGLPARGPRGSNQGRMTQFSDAMHQAAMSGS